MKFELELTSTFVEADRNAIFEPLIEYNRAKAGEPDYIPLNVLLRIENEIVGGLCANTAYSWLHIELLYLPEKLRGQGIGKMTIDKAESEAITRGCRNSWVDTHEFQSRDFYESMGYRCFGELPDYPPGFARYFMRKEL